MKYAAGGWEHCTIRMLPTGKVELVTGTSPHGQGHDTAWSQIASDTLGIPVDDIEVIHGDTRQAPYGMDTYGSRSLAVGGVAILHAAEAVVAKARVIAAHLLEVSADDLEFVDGSFRVKGDPESAKTIQAVAWEAFTSHDLPDGIDPTLFGASTVDPQVFSYPHGTHLCAVEVDTETGMTTIRKYVAVDDVGVQVNPMIVEGQIHGGITQGIAQALWEGAAYDEDGNLTTASLADYLLPTAVDVPFYVTDRTVTPSTTHPLGTKGVGEAGTIASTPAVINADHRRAAAAGRDGRADAGHPANRLAGDPGGCAVRRCGRERRCGMIPSTFDYVRPTSVDDAVAALAAGGEDAKVITGGQSLLPLLRIRLAAPTVLVDCGRIEEMRGVSDAGDALRDRRGDDAPRRACTIRWCSEHAPLLAMTDGDRRRPGRSGTAARSAGRWRMPIRPATCPRSRWRWTASWWSPARPGAGRSRPRTSSSTTSPPRCPSTRCWSRSGCRSSGPAGATTTRSSTAPRSPGRSSGWPPRCAGRTARSPRPGSR